jgi:O-antigen/teichoic acid export membrane protein
VGLSRFLWIIPQAIQTISYPATSEYWANNNHSPLQTMIDKSMKYTACILLPIGLGVGFFARDIIALIFGVGFVYAVLPLQILIIGTVIFGLVKAIGGSLPGIGRVDVNLKVTGFGAIVNIILNLLLIPIYGIIGAAIATITSFVIIALSFIYLTITIMHIKIDVKWYARTSIITVLVAALFLLSPNHYVTFLLLGMYCIILGCLIDKEEKKILKSLVFSVFHKKE